MTKYSIKKSELSVEGYFTQPAFNLLRPKTDLHGTVATFLSDFCPIRGADIRIDSDTNPLGNANVTYDLRPFDGAARVSIDKAHLALFSPHTIEEPRIAALSLAFLEAVREAIVDNSYARFFVQFAFHAAPEEIAPADYTQRYVSPVPGTLSSAIGSSVTYYFGQDGFQNSFNSGAGHVRRILGLRICPHLSWI